MEHFSCRAALSDFFLPQLTSILTINGSGVVAATPGLTRPEEVAMRECREATLAEILSDPIVLMVMAADGIDPHEFELNLRAADHSRKSHSAHATTPPLR